MTVINHKSISGITSITTPAGSDNLLTVHTSDQVEKFRIKPDGIVVSGGSSITGIATASNFKTGTTNVHNVGVEAAGINVLGADTPIGTGATIYNSGGAVFTGVVTATSFVGGLPITNGADNRVITASSASAIQGEANLTYDGANQLKMVGSGQQDFIIGSTNASAAYLILDGDSNGDAIGADYSYIAHDTGGDLVFGADNPNGDAAIIFKAGNNAEKIRITSDGRMGIGAVNPSYALMIQGAGNAAAGMYLYNNTGAEGIKIVPESNGNCRIYSSTNDHLCLGTNDTDRVTIAGDGSYMTFSGSDFGFGAFPGGTPAGKNVFIAIGDSDTGIVQDGDGQLELWANNNEVANISAIDGYLSTKPITTSNNITMGSRLVHHGDTDTYMQYDTNAIALVTAGTGRINIDANGVVNITRRLELTNSGDNHSVYEGRAWTWTSNGTGSGSVRAYMYGDSSNNLRIGTNGWNERLRIGSTGDFGFGTTNTDGHADHTNLFIGAMGNIYAETSASSSNSTSWSNNAYNASSGGWKYRSGGKVSNIYQYDGKIGFRTAGTGSAGAAITWAERFTIEDNHNIYIWGAQTGNNRAILYNGSGYFGIYGSSNNSTNRELRFHTGGGSSTECARFSSGGKLSIGSVAAANISAAKGIEISGGATAEIRLKNSGGGTGQADGFAIQKWNNGNNYIYDYDSNNILFGTSNGSRTQMDSSGRWTFSPSGAITSGSNQLVMSIVNNGGGAGSGSAYPGIAFKSTASGGGNGMAIVNFDSNWDLYSRSNNQTGLAFLKDTAANSANARMVIGDDGKTSVGTHVYDTLSKSRYSHTSFHIAGGALSIGPEGNHSSTRNGGRYCLGWYMLSYINSHSYIHLVTNMWGGGSPSGNTMYIMGGFHIHGHQYSGSGVSEERIYFHNWGNTLHGYSRHHTGTWDPGNAAYINSNGYVTLRLLSGNYRGYVIDTIQHAWYNIVDWTVTAVTSSNSTTI